MTEKFCRVCRCEGTPDQPLFHPCKCRGSIKYIHQDCLQFWLEHSNKKICDICHSKFNFKVIYNENVPKFLPFKLIIKQIFKSLIKYQYILVKYSLVIFSVLIEIPFIITLFDRIVNWQLGVKIPSDNIIKSLIFDSDNDYSITSFLLNNIPYGIKAAIIYTIIITSLIMIQNSFVGDEGFQKIINKKIGIEPKRFKLMEMLKQAQQSQRIKELRKHQNLIQFQKNAYLNRSENIIKSLHLSYKNDGLNYGDPISIEICQLIINSDLKLINDLKPSSSSSSSFSSPSSSSSSPSSPSSSLYDDAINDDKFFLTNFNPQLEISNLQSIEKLLIIDKKLRLNKIEQNLGNSFIQNYHPSNEIDSINDLFVGYPNFQFTRENAPSTALELGSLPSYGNDDDDIDDIDDADADVDVVDDVVDDGQDWANEIEQILHDVNNLPRNQPIPNQPVAQPPPPVADDIPVGLWDSPRNITFVLKLTLLANLVSLIVLISFKLVPSYIGILFISTLNTILIIPLKLLLSYISNNHLPHLNLNPIIDLFHDFVVPKLFVSFMNRNFINPIITAFSNTINYTPTNNSFERIMVMISGYTFFIILTKSVMKYMESCCNPNKSPLGGNSRLIYISLLQIISVLKVLVLIIIEWLCFPLFCGLQIEFSLVPVFNQDLYNYKLDTPLVGNFLPKFVQIWLTGTFFMYYFASFVSMIRSKILRTGVLFFIRPSDDPNLQLVHDALMRPFLLRISRIALSALVYSIYIIIEFMMVSWSIRLFSPIQILPFFNRSFLERIMFCLMFTSTGFLENVFFKFWKNVFIWLSSMLRLSSFMLDNDIPEERGIIIHKSIWSKLRNIKPNFDHPVIKSETDEYFKNFPDQSACFVPNGNYIRVPNDDHVSRKFVKTLFVKVTKTDQLLEPIPEIIDDEEKFNPYGDIDPMDVTTYTIVYKPPNFKLRLFAFFSGLWLTSMILTFTFYLINLIFGRFILWISGIDRIIGLKSYLNFDGYSMLISIGIMFQILNSWQRIKSNTGNIISVLWISILENVKNLFNILRNNFIVQHTSKLLFMIFTNLLIKTSMIPIANITNNSNIFLISSILFEIPLYYLLFLHGFEMHKYYSIGLALDLCVRSISIIASLLSSSSSSSPSSSSPSLLSLNEFQPVDSNFFGLVMFNVIMNKISNNSIKTIVYNFITLPNTSNLLNYLSFTIWISIEFYIYFQFCSNYWFKFVENTKQMYYSNMKVLSNVEDDEDDNEE